MTSIWPTLCLSASYYAIVRFLGPWYMKNREPFELKKVMLVYNLFQAIFNSWLLYKAGLLWFGPYNWRCQPIDYSNSSAGEAALNVTYWYFISKFLDFFDSFFFVLRKKFSHLSTLHVVHHGGLPIFVWFGPRFVGGGHTTFCGFLNSGIHVVMYLYYFLAALGPKVTPYLWWKRYLTKLQMIQFVVFFIHALQPLFIECDYPKIYCWIILGHGLLYFVLFTNFYIQSYIKKKKA
ncbi:elongation of very long chain fatty acids protein AAEL008004 [Eurytemora carolleeae]|uniref:elongation of very long chain fatty acids protein AAEL008004 n=1 Tax=Eurytemora carolleeae TaxID=1294199 RepID=UPI000C759F7B|nr:elongation of very long chain fatty acids protein AAEL008004 [Eurytemora carolleeae]|eukprot:XP_023335864.1 elongation of very long chain fatty acids protein AAEL008004-like [Eurytemora affinis]